jgi:MFS family permease
MITDYKPILKNKYFVYLWSSQILSQLTVNILNFIILIRLFENTNSTIATSLLWVSYALPAIFFGPMAAAFVDIFDRRSILIITNFLQSLAVFIFGFIHQGRIFLLYGIALIYSFLNQFYLPAESASLPYVLKRKFLAQANGLFFLTQQGSLILGFGGAGFLYQFVGFEKSVFICSFLLFMAFISTYFLPKIHVQRLKLNSFEKYYISFFKSIYEGYKFIKSNNVVLIPLIVTIVTQVLFTVIIVNIPLITREIFGYNVKYSGTLVVIPATLGALLGTINMPKILKTGIRKKSIIEESMLTLSVLFLLLIFITPFLVSIIKIIFSIAIIFLSGLFFIGILIPTQTFLQEVTPEKYRGRVFGNLWFLVTIATVFPIIFTGAISELLGVKFLIFIISLVILSIFYISSKFGQKYLYEIKPS